MPQPSKPEDAQSRTARKNGGFPGPRPAAALRLKVATDRAKPSKKKGG